jgi:hypothetical protein
MLSILLEISVILANEIHTDGDENVHYLKLLK